MGHNRSNHRLLTFQKQIKDRIRDKKIPFSVSQLDIRFDGAMKIGSTGNRQVMDQGKTGIEFNIFRRMLGIIHFNPLQAHFLQDRHKGFQAGIIRNSKKKRDGPEPVYHRLL